MSKKATKKRFAHFEVHNTGWHKDLPMKERREKMLLAHNGNYLASGKAMSELANVTTDKDTKKAAKVDAKWFFKEHQKKGK